MDKNASPSKISPSKPGRVLPEPGMAALDDLLSTPEGIDKFVTDIFQQRLGSVPGRPAANAEQPGSLAKSKPRRIDNAKRNEPDGRLVEARLNEFADFLVQFNNTTVKATDTRIQNIEAILEERVQRIQAAESEHEKRVGERLDSIARDIRNGVVEGVKRAFWEENQARDAALAKGVSDAIFSALGPRFDDVNRHAQENEIVLRALQTSVESFDTRLKKFETQSPSASPTSNRVLPAAASSSISSPASPNPDISATLAHQLEEIGCMLDRLSKQVEAARDEAHSDKEELASRFNTAHDDLSKALQDQLCALRSAVGVGKGCLKDTTVDSLDSDPEYPSLAERLEALAMDLQEAMEQFKDAEAARDGGSFSEGKHILQMLASHAKSNDLPKKTETAGINREQSTDKKKDGSDIEEDQRAKISTCKANKETEHVDRSILTSKASKIINLPADKRAFTNPPEPELASGPYASDFLDWSLPLPHQWPLPDPFPSLNLTLNPDLDNPLLQMTRLQLPGDSAPPDPSSSLMSPPVSCPTAPCSPTVTLKRKANAVETTRHELTSINTSSMVNQGEDAYTFDIGRSLSPPAAVGDTTLLDLERSTSPLTPLASEDEEESSDEENGDALSEPECEEESSAPAPVTRSSSPSKRRVSASSRKTTAPKQEVSKLLKYWCPNKCGHGYLHKKSMVHHTRTSCALAEMSARDVLPLPAESSKRRRLDHKTDRTSTSSRGSKRKRRGRPRKVDGTATSHVHPSEVLKKCAWPAKSMVNETFDHQLMQCDRCDSSYHYRCIGVKEGDARLVPEAAFICPPCTFINDPQASVKKNNASCCGRPDCDWPGEASNDDEDYFIVEKILGRSVARLKGPERIYLWLIKWNGYDIKECDWLGQMALPNAEELINKFYVAAKREGLKVLEDESIYLLREARNKLHLAVKRKWKWA